MSSRVPIKYQSKLKRSKPSRTSTSKLISMRKNMGYQGSGRYSAGSDNELKFFDTGVNFNFDAVAEVPATGQLNLIPQGVTENTRVGRKCVIKSIYFKGYVLMDPGMAQASDICSMYLVLDKQANGGAAAITDVISGTNIVIGVNNLSNSQRFTIIKKFEFMFNPTAGVATAFAKQIRKVNWFKRCNIPLEFSNTSGVLSGIRSNNLFLIAGTSTVTDDLATIDMTCRLRFSDGS